MFARTIHDRLAGFLLRERRHAPRWRPLFDELLREPSAALLEVLLARQRRSLADLGLAEERYVPGEEEASSRLLEGSTLAGSTLAGSTLAGSTLAGGAKLQGLVRAELSISGELPRPCRKGIFAKPHTYSAWVRFSGPGPEAAPDIDAPWLPSLDGGGPRLDLKLMGVPGPKLLDDESLTQDLCCVGSPSSPTASVLDQAQLESWRSRELPLFYFFDRQRPHLLELLLHALYSEPVPNLLEKRYYGSGPLLCGQGLAMRYSLRPRAITHTPIPGLPERPPESYLRQALVQTLAGGEVLFDLLIQLQTDARVMPIEAAAVRWPQRLAPWLTVGTLRIPQQAFDSEAQRRFAQRLRFTPWHALPDHRPLGSQNRARRRLYLAQLAAEQQHALASAEPLGRLEPTGAERFEAAPSGAPSSEPAAPAVAPRSDEHVARSTTRQVDDRARLRASAAAAERFRAR